MLESQITCDWRQDARPLHLGRSGGMSDDLVSQPEIQYFDPKVKSFAHRIILIAFNILNIKHLARRDFGTAIAPLFSPDPGPDAWVRVNWSNKLKG